MAAPRRSAPDSLAVRLNLGLLSFSRHWLRVMLIALAIFAALPWVAPVLMQVGLTGPARALYFGYGAFCHQFAFRSFFLFGEQGAYPREVADTGYRPYEAYIADSPEFDTALSNYVGVEGFSRFPTVAAFDPFVWSPDLQFGSRDFFGSPEMGYKTAVCQRDLALYGGLLAGGLLYSIPAVRRRLRPVPIWLYLIAGVAPIAIDGFSQLISYASGSPWPIRETEPAFRVMTGALFGLMSAWLVFPYLDISMRDVRLEVEDKLRRAGLIGPN